MLSSKNILIYNEELLIALSNLVNEEKSPPMILVTHHLEEIPVGFGHLLLLKNNPLLCHSHWKLMYGWTQIVPLFESVGECWF
mgnify:CR=1 FL=1